MGVDYSWKIVCLRFDLFSSLLQIVLGSFSCVQAFLVREMAIFRDGAREHKWIANSRGDRHGPFGREGQMFRAVARATRRPPCLEPSLARNSSRMSECTSPCGTAISRICARPTEKSAESIAARSWRIRGHNGIIETLSRLYRQVH